MMLPGGAVHAETNGHADVDGVRLQPKHKVGVGARVARGRLHGAFVSHIRSHKPLVLRCIIAAMN